MTGNQTGAVGVNRLSGAKNFLAVCICRRVHRSSSRQSWQARPHSDRAPI